MPARTISSGGVSSLVDFVRSLANASDDATRIDRLRLLEELKAATSAVQMSLATDFDASQRAAQQAAQRAARVGADGDRVPPKPGRGIVPQLGLALRRSPHATQRWLAAAQTLTHDLPGTFVELARGRVPEHRAVIVARELAVLTKADRHRADAELAPQLAAWGDRQVEGEARKACYRLDPHAVVNRARIAESERRVTLRPAPDVMSRLSAELPVAQGVACYASLSRHADTLKNSGDPRSRGQIMADTLVQRLTGQASADAVPVEISLVMSAETLLAREGEPGRDEPGLIDGHGPIPAALARELATGRTAAAWLRRLFTTPATGRLVQMETHRRAFTTSQQLFLRQRDQTCRTPWCDAPIRHADHIRPHAAGGRTTIDNGQGLCEACNHAKAAPGWASRAAPDGQVITRTPTGHTYRSSEPVPLGSSTCARSRLERRAAECIVDFLFRAA